MSRLSYGVRPENVPAIEPREPRRQVTWDHQSVCVKTRNGRDDYCTATAFTALERPPEYGASSTSSREDSQEHRRHSQHPFIIQVSAESPSERITGPFYEFWSTDSCSDISTPAAEEFRNPESSTPDTRRQDRPEDRQHQLISPPSTQ